MLKIKKGKIERVGREKHIYIYIYIADAPSFGCSWYLTSATSAIETMLSFSMFVYKFFS